MNTLILCAGNKYGPAMGGASLEGCRNDLPGYYRCVHENLFEENNINVVVLADETNTIGNQVAALTEAVRVAGDGEWVRYHDSSHGADPGIVCYDSDWNDPENTFFTADRYGEILSKANPKARLFLTFDACEFGDSMRSLLNGFRSESPRFVQDPSKPPTRAIASIHPFLPRGISNLVTIAGCQRGKTCADVRDQLGAYGAFSHFLFPEAKKGMLTSELLNVVNKDFAENEFDQRAVRTGPDWNFI